MTDDPGPAAALGRIDRPVFALDDGWRFTYLNDRARRFLGEENLEDEVIWDALPGVAKTDVPETFHEARSTGESRRTTVTMKDDRRMEFEVYPGDSGTTVLLADVTDRYRRKQRRQQYEAAFEAADDPLYLLEPGGQFRMVNEAMVEYTGYSREELLGAGMDLLLDDDQIQRAEERIRDAVLEDDQSVGRIEVTIETATGERRPCVASVALLPSDVGGTVGVMRDVTERRQREQRVAVLDRVLRHNIRNEMNVVVGRAQIAKREASPEVAEHIDKVIETSQDLLAVSQDIRRFADALDPGMGNARNREALVLVQGVVEELQEIYPSAEIRLTVRVAPWMRAYDSVQAAVREVIENAVIHAGDDRISVTLDADGPPGDGEVVVRVADQGSGLPEQERKVLTAGGESQLTHASGIGLWLVNWSVTKSGGELDFEENDPQGSIVTIRLPRVHPPEDTPDEESAGPNARADGGE